MPEVIAAEAVAAEAAPAASTAVDGGAAATDTEDQA
jgi:hypothetical protein